MTDLNGQGPALVTGATRGIGKGYAIGLGEAGATVYITGRSTAPDQAAAPASIPGTLEETQAAVESAGGVCIPVQTDHADDRAGARALSFALSRNSRGKLDSPGQ